MFKSIFSNRVFIGVLVFVVCAAASLYLLQLRMPKEPIKIYTAVEPLPKSTAEVPVGDIVEDTSVPSGADLSVPESLTSEFSLDGLTLEEKRRILEAKLAEANEIKAAQQAKLEALQKHSEALQKHSEALQVELEALREEKKQSEEDRATVQVLRAYNDWLKEYNAEGDDLSAFAAYYNQNPSSTAEEEKYAEYVRKRQAERPMEFLMATNELPLPFREQFILKYHENLVRDLGVEEANKIFILR